MYLASPDLRFDCMTTPEQEMLSLQIDGRVERDTWLGSEPSRRAETRSAGVVESELVLNFS
jgi:hypothetical protein